MPLYEFYCSECGKKFEELCSSSVKKVRCPSCGKESARVFSTFRTSGTSGGGCSSAASSGG
ncbi:MAG TPA: zinc ribbon domain-containing protein [Firmicutes bacterium]|nr:zinc ribbon domain-containing protein [Bacillota bacterium]